MQRMVEVVVPLCVHPDPARSDRSDDSRVVVGALRDEKAGPPQAVPQVTDRLGQPGQEGPGGTIDDLVYGVEAETVDVVIGEPLPGVLREVGPDVIGARAVEVDRRAPRG